MVWLYYCLVRKSKDYVYGIWVYKVLGLWKGYYRVKKSLVSCMKPWTEARNNKYMKYHSKLTYQLCDNGIDNAKCWYKPPINVIHSQLTTEYRWHLCLIIYNHCCSYNWKSSKSYLISWTEQYFQTYTLCHIEPWFCLLSIRAVC